jgi:hypothetical protein
MSPCPVAAQNLHRDDLGSGHSVEILLKIYAKCLDGEEEEYQQRMRDALGRQVDVRTSEAQPNGGAYVAQARGNLAAYLP